MTPDYGWGIKGGSIRELEPLPDTTSFPAPEVVADEPVLETAALVPPKFQSDLEFDTTSDPSYVAQKAVEWNAWDSTSSPSRRMLTLPAAPKKTARELPIVPILLAAMTFGLVLMMAGGFTITSNASAEKTDTALTARAVTSPGATIASNRGIQLTFGPQWVSVPTDKAELAGFVRAQSGRHPNIEKYVPKQSISQLAAMGLWIDALGNLHASVTAVPITGETDPSVLQHQASAIAAKYEGVNVTSKLTTFNKYPSLLISFKIHATSSAPTQFVEIAMVHSGRTSAAITVQARDPQTAAKQMKEIGSTLVLR